MNKDNIKIFRSPSDLAIGFAGILYSRIIDLLKQNEKLNIALSGGNTPNELFNVLAADYKDKIEWNRIDIYWVDERCVPVDSPESNFGNAEIYLLSKININHDNIHRIKGETEPEHEAARYSDIVLKNVKLHNSLPSFEIIILGIGEDGHTASIFPNQIELMLSEMIYEVSVHPNTGQKRITMTGPVINNASTIYFLVSGKSKSTVIHDILNHKLEANKYPANYIKPVFGELFWILDKNSIKQK